MIVVEYFCFALICAGPCGISYRSRPGEANLEPNMILSNGELIIYRLTKQNLLLR